MNEATIRQILLITDGHSNQGEDPVMVASLAQEQGIAVNVIGVMDKNLLDPSCEAEVGNIAKAGGGVSQIVYAEALSHTVQMVTRKAMTQTLHGVINKQLVNILGPNKTMTDLSPAERGQVAEVVDDLSEMSNLNVLILIDTSASMSSKLEAVKEALLDLSLSLNARTGENLFSVCLFPGKNSVEKLLDWTPKLEMLSKVFPNLTTGGLTPTGPALREALAQFTKLQHNNDTEYVDYYVEQSL